MNKNIEIEMNILKVKSEMERLERELAEHYLKKHTYNSGLHKGALEKALKPHLVTLDILEKEKESYENRVKSSSNSLLNCVLKLDEGKYYYQTPDRNEPLEIKLSDGSNEKITLEYLCKTQSTFKSASTIESEYNKVRGHGHEPSSADRVNSVISSLRKKFKVTKERKIYDPFKVENKKYKLDCSTEET